MCTRPKLVNIGALGHYQKGYNKPWAYSQFKFCPCGMCIECRNMRREEYTQRLKHEIETSNYIASFITLTYRDEELPLLLPRGSAVVGSYFGSCPPAFGSTLSRSDAKQFMDKLTKRFRRKYGKERNFKYVCVGEYGDDGHRPHLHIIIVGLPAYERKMVYDTWNKGRIDIEPVGNGAIRYVLSYIDKQVFGANELYESYGDFQPPFALFSKGIGEKWNKIHMSEFNQYGEIKYASGKKYTLNPYYRRKYDFDTKPYITPFSDSVVNWAKQRNMSLADAYIERCRVKEVELQRKQIHKREPLFIASKHIIKKDFSMLQSKKNITEKDYSDFTYKYLKRDDFLIFNKKILDIYANSVSIKCINNFKKKFNL